MSPLRKRAEDALRERLSGLSQEPEVISQENAKRLQYELSVYSIELEMQNEELRRALDELEKTRSRYFELYDLAPVGYCTISESGLIVQANLTATTLLGVPRVELIHRPISQFIEYQNQTVFYSHRDLLLTSGQAQSFDLRMISAGGTTFWAHIDAVAAQGDDGAPVMRMIISDASFRKSMELELVAALDAAEAANRAKDVFIGNLSHEFMTPMNGILGFCEILQRKLTEPKQLSWIASIKQSANQLLAILNNMLDFSKLKAGRLELHWTEFNFRDFMEQVVAHHRQLAIAKGLAFVVEVDSGFPKTLVSDHDRLKLVIDHLLDNALKFTPSGAITLHASTSHVKPDQELLRFEIQDTGIGVDDATQKIIFDPFVQGDSSLTRAFGGNGLGLPISKNLVKLMGGEIGMTSRPGDGSTFWFTVPIKAIRAGGSKDSPMTRSE